jgi:hypothetical protein
MKMKSMKNRVLTAFGLLIVGTYAGIELTLDRLGYVTTVLPFLPLAWQRALVSDPVVIWATGICFFVAIILLGGVALKVANMAETARKTAQKAWNFEPQFLAFQEEFRTKFAGFESNVTHLAEQWSLNNQKLETVTGTVERLAQDYQEAAANLRIANTEHLNDLITSSMNNIEMRLMERRDTFEREMRHEIKMGAENVGNTLQQFRVELNELKDGDDAG